MYIHIHTYLVPSRQDQKVLVTMGQADHYQTPQAHSFASFMSLMLCLLCLGCFLNPSPQNTAYSPRTIPDTPHGYFCSGFLGRLYLIFPFWLFSLTNRTVFLWGRYLVWLGQH